MLGMTVLYIAHVYYAKSHIRGVLSCVCPVCFVPVACLTSYPFLSSSVACEFTVTPASCRTGRYPALSVTWGRAAVLALRAL